MPGVEWRQQDTPRGGGRRQAAVAVLAAAAVAAASRKPSLVSNGLRALTDTLQIRNPASALCSRQELPGGG